MSQIIVKSAARVLGVLEFFSSVRRAATASEIQNELGLPQSSTSVLLRSLVALGYLEYLPESRQFCPTVRIALLGDWIPEAMHVPLTEQLKTLQCSTEEIVVLGRRHGAEIQYVRIIYSDHKPHDDPLGDRPLTTTACGRALLSTIAPKKARSIIRRNNATVTDPCLRVNEESFMSSLKEIRDTRIAETNPALDGIPGYYGFATVLPTGSESEQLSLGVVGPTERILRKRTELIKALQTAANLPCMGPMPEFRDESLNVVKSSRE